MCNSKCIEKKEQRDNQTPVKEDYLQGPPTTGDHYASPKKGPSLQPARGSYPAGYPPHPQPSQRRRPDTKKRPLPQQQNQYNGYNFYPFDSSGYGMRDSDDSMYPGRNQDGLDSELGSAQGVYPYNLDHRQEYPGYYSGDR